MCAFLAFTRKPLHSVHRSTVWLDCAAAEIDGLDVKGMMVKHKLARAIADIGFMNAAAGLTTRWLCAANSSSGTTNGNNFSAKGLNFSNPYGRSFGGVRLAGNFVKK